MSLLRTSSTRLQNVFRIHVPNLFRRHLLATNIGISFALSGLGDYLQQKYEKYDQGSKAGQGAAKTPFKWNVYRSFHMSATYGLTSGVLIHYWYNLLDRFLPGSGIRIVIGKIFYDQILFSPICIGTCLVADSLMEGHAWRRMAAEVATKGYYLYIADCLVWPPAQFVNFYFLPTRYRVAFDNIVSLGVDVYTSHVKHQIHTDKAMYLDSDHSKTTEGVKNIHSENLICKENGLSNAEREET